MNLKFLTVKSLKLCNKKAPILRGTCGSRKVGRKPSEGWKETEQSAVFCSLAWRSSALTENLAQFTTYTLSLWYDQFVTIKIIHINKS